MYIVLTQLFLQFKEQSWFEQWYTIFWVKNLHIHEKLYVYGTNVHHKNLTSFYGFYFFKTSA
jgi:hypothetical protein